MSCNREGNRCTMRMNERSNTRNMATHMFRRAMGPHTHILVSNPTAEAIMQGQWHNKRR